MNIRIIRDGEVFNAAWAKKLADAGGCDVCNGEYVRLPRGIFPFVCDEHYDVVLALERANAVLGRLTPPIA